MYDLDMKSLRLFTAVCDYGNLKQAALAEHIEPSAISKRLTQLEDQLGTRILVRGRKRAVPTPAGQVLLQHARSVLFSVERLGADLASFRGGIKGLVRLAASPSAIAESLLDDLASFMTHPEHEGIQITIEERVSRDLVGLVRDRIVSLGICWGNADFGELDHRPYRQDELSLAVPVGHPLADQEAVHFEETLGYDHIGLHNATAVASMLSREAAKVGKLVNYRVIVSNFDAAYRVVAAGLGISVIPREVQHIHSSANKVRIVRLLNPWVRRQFAICFRDESELSPAARRLLEFLVRPAQAG